MMDFSIVSEGERTSSFAPGINTVSPTVIKVVGCGGCGCNAVNNMIDFGIQGVQFISLNTDVQALSVSKAETRIQIGKKITNGLGAGMHPEVGEAAAKEEEENIKKLLKGSDMVFITAGLGGGTGTGAAPIVAKIAKELGILTVAVVTTPFSFEGPIRMQLAEEGVKKLRGEVDSLIVLPNQRVFEGSEKKPSAMGAFKIVDDILRQAVKGISDIITQTGLVNRDFKDVESVMKGQGDAILGIGVGEGDNRAVDAATNAINNKLLADTHIDGAKNILIGVFGNEDVGMDECETIAQIVTASADKNVRVLWGLYIDPSMGDKISATVIATGFKSANQLDAAESEAQEDDSDGNYIGIGKFEDVLKGKTSAPVTQDLFGSTIYEDTQVSPVSKTASQGARNGSLGAAMTNAAHMNRNTPPAGFSDDGDLAKPAVWRSNLSRTINLRDK